MNIAIVAHKLQRVSSHRTLKFIRLISRSSSGVVIVDTILSQIVRSSLSRGQLHITAPITTQPEGVLPSFNFICPEIFVDCASLDNFLPKDSGSMQIEEKMSKNVVEALHTNLHKKYEWARRYVSNS